MKSYGRNTSIIKRSHADNSVNTVVSRTITFAHKASSFSPHIDLANLTTPPEFAAQGFANPDPTTVYFLRLFKQNVSIVSSFKGELVNYSDYEFNSANVISLLGGLTTEPGEIFTIKVVIPNDVDLNAFLEFINNPEQIINLAEFNLAQVPDQYVNISQSSLLNTLQYVASKNRQTQIVFSSSIFTTGSFPGSASYSGGVLLPDGRVFCVPRFATTARIYDPVANAVTTPSGTYPGSTTAYIGGVLLPDGRVFCIPTNATTARIYNPVTDTLTTPSGTYPGSTAYAGGVLLPDGRVFCVPSNATTARIYNPVTDTLITPSGTYPGSGAYVLGVLLPDGRVFCVPYNATTTTILSGSFSTPSINTPFPKHICISSYYNKY